MSTSILLIRHAESEMNATGTHLVGGRSNHTPLSVHGRRSAAQLGHRLRHPSWTPAAVYCTSAHRSTQTAQLISQHANWPAPQIHDDFLELSQGRAEGQPRDQWWTPETIAAMHEDPLHHRLAPDAETHAEVQRRVTRGLYSLANTHPDSSVAVIGHGIAIRSLLWSLSNSDHEQGFRNRPIRNLGLIHLIVKPDELTFAGRVQLAPNTPMFSAIDRA